MLAMRADIRIIKGMSNQANTDRISTLTAKRDDAAKALEVAAKRFRAGAKGPLADVLEMAMEDAFEDLTQAGQDLREARDGYRLTHTRGACGGDHVHNERCAHLRGQ
jgi:hypothetical protein